MWRPLVSHNLFSWLGRSSSCRSKCPLDTCRHQLQSYNIEKAASFRLRLKCSHNQFSRPVARQLSSAYMCLTSVFGMGTGGPTWQSIRTRFRKRFSPSYIKQCLRAFCYQLFIAYLLVTHTGFEPMLTAWEAAVLTTWPMGRWCSFRDSNPGPTD